MNSYDIIRINDYISYIPSCGEPLSGDVGIIYGKNRTYLYDVGSTLGCLEFLHSIPGKFSIVASHFHGDHIWWLTTHKKGDAGVKPGDTISLDYKRPAYSELYVSQQTKKYTGDGIVVEEPLIIEDETITGEPLKIEIRPIPSSHSKGCLLMMVNEELIFLGDSTYCSWKTGSTDGDEEGRPGVGHAEYNVQLLQAEIELLSALKAEKVALSHDRKFIRPKKVVIREFQSVYALREPGKNTIEMIRK